MTVQEIIKSFELYLDDGTELSDQEELDLFNKVYADIWTNYQWEVAKIAFNGVISGTTIDLPTDIAFICENAKYTDVSQNNYGVGNASPKLVWIDNSYYQLVNWSDRKQHQNGGYCWIDWSTKKLTFSESKSGNVSFDYVALPETLTLTDTPVFPSAYHPVFYHAMAVDDYMIQQFDKAKSYAPENQAKYQYWLDKMVMWNSNLLMN